jgi:hypothetical protein
LLLAVAMTPLSFAVWCSDVSTLPTLLLSSIYTPVATLLLGHSRNRFWAVDNLWSRSKLSRWKRCILYIHSCCTVHYSTLHCRCLQSSLFRLPLSCYFYKHITLLI